MQSTDLLGLFYCRCSIFALSAGEKSDEKSRNWSNCEIDCEAVPDL